MFVKSDASIDVINGAPATYEAKATKTLLLSYNQGINYSDYVYYEKANDAIQKYSSGTIEIVLAPGVTASQDKSYRSGTLTIDTSAEGSEYTGTITLTSTSAKSVIKFPEGGGHYGVTASTGQLHVEETIADGIVTRTYSLLADISNPEAKVGDTSYSTVYDAFYAIDGTTDNKTIVLQKDVTNAGIVTNGTATGGDGKTVATFDLNGKSIGIGSVAAGNNADYALTIIDSSEGKTGTVTNSDASLFILALTGISDYSGSYTLKVQAGTWQFDPSAVNINGEIRNLVDEGYVARDNGNGTWTVVETTRVAQIGTTKYSTLQSAVDAAQQLGGEQTINLIGDISGETVTIKEVANFKLTIDGKKDDSSNYTVDALIIVDGLRANGGSNTNGASVTLQNIAFVRTVSTDGIQATHYPHHLTIQDCTYSGSDNDKWFLNASVDGPLYGVTVKNVTVEHARLIYAPLGLEAVFENIVATNDVKVGFNIKTEGQVSIKNCQVTTSKYAFRDYKDGYTGTITLEGNTFISTSEESDEGAIVNRGGAVGTAKINVVSGSYSGHIKVLNNKEGVLAVSGGIFSEPVAEEFCAEGYITAANPDTETNEAYPYMVKEGKYVAQVGEQKFETFTEAVAALTEENNTITLLDNIAEPYTLAEAQSLNVNLNGKTLNVKVPEGFILKTTVADGVTTYVCAAPVAKIGDTMFASLADAVAAVPADGTEATTITMIADETINVEGYAITIPATKNVVLELNGHQIIGACVSTGTSALIRNLGTLTIQDNTDANKDGSGDGKIIAGADPTWTWDGSDDYSGSYASNLVRNEGTLVIEGGNLNNVSSGSAAYAIDNYGSGKITINGGKVDAAKASAIRMFYVNGGSITVNDGTIGHYTSDDDCSYMGVQVMSGANVNVSVNGGTIAGLYALYANNTGGGITISGGSFDGYVGFAAPVPNISITDGTFYAWAGTWGDQTKFISGGSFYENPDAEYIADGFVAVKQGDVYLVIPESLLPNAPTIFHDSGTYEGAIDVAIAGQGTIMYKLGDGEAQTYTTPIAINATTTVTAWTEQDGFKSSEVSKTFTIEAKAKGAVVEDGYYTIQTSGGKYVNVAGRKTVTLVDDTKSAGTVIRVSAEEDGVKVLRSQAVDLPRYAERAMSYVPEIVKEVVNKLAGSVDDPIIGEQGAELILDKFNQEFDYHLYLEKTGDAYRIYGRTPSMKPVVDFYAENKELVDSRLPRVEDFVKEVLQKVVDKVGHGQSVVDMFKVKTIWTNMGGTLTDPDVDQAKFFEEVLSSEANVWNFAYQTGMLYWDKVKGYLTEKAGELGDYGKYLEKIPHVQPNFKYYIVPGETGLDIISKGNEAILNDNASTAWTLTKRESFDVTLPVEKVVNIYPTSSGGTTTTYNEYYGTLYTDFAYQLPADVVAYKIDGIDVVKGKAYIKKTKLENILPAQTPVMLVSNTADIELTLVAGDVAAVSEGELRGNDYLINEYEINSSQAEGIMMILQKLSESLYNEYEHLQRRNAGTVNNKYFFGLAVDPDLGDAYKTKTGNEMENTPVRVLTKKEDGTIAFTESWSTLAGNESFIFNEEYPDILLSRVGDVNRDGQVTIADVTALVNIVLGKVTYPANADKYDFEAANVNGDELISIADVTALVNIILGK